MEITTKKNEIPCYKNVRSKLHKWRPTITVQLYSTNNSEIKTPKYFQPIYYNFFINCTCHSICHSLLRWTLEIDSSLNTHIFEVKKKGTWHPLQRISRISSIIFIICDNTKSNLVDSFKYLLITFCWLSLKRTRIQTKSKNKGGERVLLSTVILSLFMALVLTWNCERVSSLAFLKMVRHSLIPSDRRQNFM